MDKKLSSKLTSYNGKRMSSLSAMRTQKPLNAKKHRNSERKEPNLKMKKATSLRMKMIEQHSTLTLLSRKKKIKLQSLLLGEKATNQLLVKKEVSALITIHLVMSSWMSLMPQPVVKVTTLKK